MIALQEELRKVWKSRLKTAQNDVSRVYGGAYCSEDQNAHRIPGKEAVLTGFQMQMGTVLGI